MMLREMIAATWERQRVVSWSSGREVEQNKNKLGFAAVQQAKADFTRVTMSQLKSSHTASWRKLKVRSCVPYRMSTALKVCTLFVSSKWSDGGIFQDAKCMPIMAACFSLTSPGRMRVSCTRLPENEKLVIAASNRQGMFCRWYECAR